MKEAGRTWHWRSMSSFSRCCERRGCSNVLELRFTMSPILLLCRANLVICSHQVARRYEFQRRNKDCKRAFTLPRRVGRSRWGVCGDLEQNRKLKLAMDIISIVVESLRPGTASPRLLNYSTKRATKIFKESLRYYSCLPTCVWGSIGFWESFFS